MSFIMTKWQFLMMWSSYDHNYSSSIWKLLILAYFTYFLLYFTVSAPNVGISLVQSFQCPDNSKGFQLWERLQLCVCLSELKRMPPNWQQPKVISSDRSSCAPLMRECVRGCGCVVLGTSWFLSVNVCRCIKPNQLNFLTMHAWPPPNL